MAYTGSLDLDFYFLYIAIFVKPLQKSDYIYKRFMNIGVCVCVCVCVWLADVHLGCSETDLEEESGFDCSLRREEEGVF